MGAMLNKVAYYAKGAILNTLTKVNFTSIKMKKTTILAIFVTFFWLTGVITLVSLRWAGFNSLTPNEWGDFLASSVAFPLALIWLVAGYLQQGKELRVTIRALKEQQRELERRVTANNEMVTRSEIPAQIVHH